MPDRHAIVKNPVVWFASGGIMTGCGQRSYWTDPITNRPFHADVCLLGQKSNATAEPLARGIVIVMRQPDVDTI
jgi:hypothetical protein